jgi:hypothetical protein
MCNGTVSKNGRGLNLLEAVWSLLSRGRELKQAVKSEMWDFLYTKMFARAEDPFRPCKRGEVSRRGWGLTSLPGRQINWGTDFCHTHRSVE